MAPEAYLYAIPYEYYKEHGIRKYGFHGTSHHYVTLATAKFLGKDVENVNIITCHLGNGCSMAAVQNGKVVDTTMGLTPLEGLMMGTRSGDMDPAAVLRMIELGNTAKEVDNILNKKSGLLGVSGVSNDCRNISAEAKEGNHRAELALKILVTGIKKYIGSYTAEMNGLDVLVFTAGIGENQWNIREMVCREMSYLGIEIDEDKNKNFERGVPFNITKDGAKVQTWIIPTDEEYMIAIDTQRLAFN
jgi:acetate kinase